ncbi:MAG: GNAT family N-acetyltransferase [Thiohalomonadales bacterium]
MEQSNITTSRLTLRPFKKEDSFDVQKLVGNVNVSKSTLSIPHPYDNKQAKEWIACHQLQWYQKIAANYAIEYSATGDLLGSISLMDIEKSEASLGYWVGEPYWNMGFCTEASTAIIRFAFNAMGLQKLTANHASNNPASGKVMRKIGMAHVGHSLVRRLNGSEIGIEQYEMHRV